MRIFTIHKIYSFLALSLFLYSCAFHTGSVSSGNAAVTNESFNVEYAQGMAKTTQILGIGGLNKDALILEAKKDLYKRNPLKEGQTLGLITVDFKYSYFILVSTTIVTFSAEIVDFKNNPKQYENNKKNREKFINSTGFISPTTNYTIGETIEYISNNDTLKATIVSAENDYLIVKDEKEKNIKIKTKSVVQ